MYKITEMIVNNKSTKFKKSIYLVIDAYDLMQLMMI